jgi:hypothetical protein
MTSQSLTYLIRIDGATRDSTLKGYEGWFSDEYTFGVLSQFSGGAGGSGGSGKAHFDRSRDPNVKSEGRPGLIDPMRRKVVACCSPQVTIVQPPPTYIDHVTQFALSS